MPDKLVRITLRVPEELHKKVEAVRLQRGKGARQVDVYRDATWAYINQQEDIIGSRAHFQRSLREKVEALKEDIDQATDDLQKAIPNATADQIMPKFKELEEQIARLSFLVMAAMFQDASAWSKVLPAFTKQQQALGEILGAALRATHRQEELLNQLIDQALAQEPSADK